ncbi:MAG TPA: TerB family tellurite resistance protein [Candidatus Sulfotelmatobacter sp.]|nr:TerB family tellurite resistance protein [Candidatus Sulfotelmatobacter sp.]
MTLWARLMRSATGPADGGPLGFPAAALGDLDAHRADAGRGDDGADATKSVAFTIGVIALGAKMAKADGEVTRDEVAAFRQFFTVPPDQEANVQRFFDQAKRDVAGYEVYARRIARLFKRNPSVLEKLLGGLFHIAKADGAVPAPELEYLRNVARIFGFDAVQFERIRRSHLGSELIAEDPYAVLGLARGAGDDELKMAYRRLMREHHPDRLIGAGMPAEAITLANQKVAAIAAAWAQVRSERNIP